MKKALIFALLAVTATPALAGYVGGYTRSNGTYVQPHYQSAPDSNLFNNYSTKGNTNPYTGEAGTADPYKQNYGTSRKSNCAYSTLC